MREIKFRGKSKRFGIWLYGSLINNAFFKSGTGEPIPYILDTNTIEYDCFEEIGDQLDEHEVIAESVGKYTGLKDKNGTEIYEGDILLIKTDVYDPIISEVAWGGTEYPAFDLPKYDGYGMNAFSAIYHNDVKETLEIIGNIYENAELLESK